MLQIICLIFNIFINIAYLRGFLLFSGMNRRGRCTPRVLLRHVQGVHIVTIFHVKPTLTHNLQLKVRFPFFRRGGLTTLSGCGHKESRHSKMNVCLFFYLYTESYFLKSSDISIITSLSSCAL